MDRNLALELVRVTEAAALACGRWVGKGDKMAAEESDTEAMRRTLDSIEISGTVVIGVGEEAVPEAVRLYSIYPNPFTPQTTIRFELSVAGMTELSVYSLSGRRVRTLVNEERPVGAHRVVWNGRDDYGTPAASGVYFFRLQAGGVTQTRKVVLIN